MIHIQKHFPPELARRWRKVMRDNRGTIAEGQPPHRLENSTSCSISGCTPEAHNFSQVKAGSTPAVSTFEKWKLSQQRQSWVYAGIVVPLIGLLLVFVVAKGCR